MSASDISPLLSPFDLNGLRLPNRFVMPGMQRRFVENGVLMPQMIDYYRRRVEGGVGLIIGEACSIDHPSGSFHTRFARITEEGLERWGRCIDAVHAAGGKMFIQLSHPGALRTDDRARPDTVALSASGLYKAGKSNGRAATLEELDEIKASFAEAAAYIKQTGADGVEVHGCHGFFLDEFLWAETNLREDAYGGDFAGRLRYPSEVVAAVRAAVGPDYPISFRFSQWKEVDYQARIAETPDDLRFFLQTLRSAGVDVFHASTRRFYTPAWPSSDLSLAGWTKSLTDAPVIAVGSVGLTVDVMDSLLDAGREAEFAGEAHLAELMRRFSNFEFDLIAVGRSIISDPQWVRKVHERRFGEIAPFRKADIGEKLEPSLIEDVHRD